MRFLLCAAMILALAGQAAAQGKVSAGEAHVLSAFATGADPLVLAENVKAGPVLRAQLGVDTDSRGIYEWVATHTAGTRPRVTLLAPAEAASHASLGLTPGEQLMRVEAGAAAFLVQYSAARKNITFVEQLSAPSANAPLLKPAAPLAALPPPPAPAPRAAPAVKPTPPRTGPRGECVVKPVMSEDDIWNCSAPTPAAVAAPPAPSVAAPEPPAPPAPTVALAAPAPALKASAECVIKPVMSEQDLRNCASSTQASTPMLETPAAPVAALPVVPQAAVKTPAECIIKPVMSDQDLRNCASARGSTAPPPPAIETAAAATVAPPRASAAAAPRDCVIKPVMSDDDLRICASARGSTAPPPTVMETSAAPQVRAAPVPSAPKECVIKPVMSDDDLRACGIRR
jgi:hypothetical protein